MKKQLKATAMTFPAPVFIVATYNEDGTANAMNAAWGGVCGVAPPSIQVSLNTGRKTRENVLRTGCFTINFGGEDLMEVSDYLGLVSGKKGDKLSKVGITVTRSSHVDAPILDQYPLSLECKVSDTKEIGPHLMVIGEIKGISADEAILDEAGNISIEKLAPIGLDPVGHNYVAFREVVGHAFDVGKRYLQK